MKKILLASFAIFATALLTNCNSSGGGTSTTLSAGGKMTAGLGSAVSTFQKLGDAMGGGSFMTTESMPGSVHTASASTRCTIHADPGEDGYNGGIVDGTVSDGERYSESDTNFALQKFYCTLASETTGPESISGAVRLLKTVSCALEKQLGTLAFDGTPVPITSLTLDNTCATQAMLNDMGASGAPSVTMSLTGTVTTALNPTFAEIPANTHYSHGIRFSVPGGLGSADPFLFIIVAKFNPAIGGDPVEAGDFEFATYATGTGNGQAAEFAAGKIDRNANRIWFEMRANRIKSSISDPNCPADSMSCGWARHIRLAADVTINNGDLTSVSNFTGIISDANDSTGVTGGSDRASVITATGALATGLTGKIYQLAASPASLTGGSTIAAYTPGLVTCVTGASSITTSCGSAPSALTPSGPIQVFAMTANSGTWLEHASENGGIGFSGAATIADEQFVQ